jgi:uncharacterized protein (DUF342 family)
LEERETNLIEAEEHRERYVEACRKFEEMHLDCLSSIVVVVVVVDEGKEEEQRQRYAQINEQRHQLSQLYEKLDRETRSHFAQHYLDLDKRANSLAEQLSEQIIEAESSLQRSNEHRARLNDVEQQLDQIEAQLATPASLTSELFKVTKREKERKRSSQRVSFVSSRN